MKYRWGFLDENDTFSECQPKVDDSTAIDFTQESGEIFYRGKINGSLAFRFEFDDILALGYNYEHRIVLQWYDADNDEWKEVWKGRFALTDCEIDYDTKTITVQPTTLDRYTKILDAYENEYNLVKLEAKRQAANILIRPCYQIYCAGDMRISNFVGGNFWESDCEQSASPTACENALFFTPLRNIAWFTLTYTSGVYAGKYAIYYARFNMSANPDFTTYLFPFDGRIYNDDGTYIEDTLQCKLELNIGFKWEFYIKDANDNIVLRVYYNMLGDNYGDNYFAYEEGAMIEDSYFRWDRFYGRAICRTNLTNVTIGGNTYTLNDFPSSDKNYNKILTIAATDVYPDIDTQEEPSGWPQTTNGWYFLKPADTSTRHYWPIIPDEWKCVSYWWYPTTLNTRIDELLTSEHTISDTYNMRSVLTKLMQKADWNGTYFISGILGGSQNYAGFRFFPLITPKSNIISSFYDTPAQNAPITLANIINMLKQAYQIYWHIDSNNNVHFEHISYYDNGLHYSEESPDVLVDLETELHTNTKNNKVFGQNKVKFEKNDMPEQYTFEWMDKQTRSFDGFPIRCLDAYVQKGQTEDKTAGNFSVDVDMILSSPNEFSKDGFVLLAMPSKDENSYYSTLQLESFTIIDENGDRYNVTIQNSDAAFIKIHENMWRYSLPCENVNINNEDTTAITTGRFKVQNVEFADSVMAEILKDIDNCNKVIRTQQGDGHIKTLSINLNSLVAKGDLLFNFVGRWYYLKGTALGNSIVIFVNGESTTIEVSANKFTYRYKEPISTLNFNAADVVSVNFADCDKLDNLTSCDNMFDGCEELLAVDFGNKTFAAVTSANNMFRGCVALTTLICPDSSTWKADLDLSDCPDLTTESFYDLIKFLYYYNSGVHTITPNTTMWNALDADTQNDLIAKATDRGWTIGIPAQYSITGQSAANTVYATINGSPVEIPVTAGHWQYDYNAAITSISFENDADVTDIDFSLSDGLAGVTSLNDAFKNCAGLTSLDFTNCDLTNVASASDAFAGCVALYELIIPAGTWKPDIDLSDTSIVYSEMSNIVNGLYTYTSGTHTITWNSTIWDALSVAQQQTIFDACQLKYWTCNAVAVVYVVRGTSSAASETFNIQFIQDGSLIPDAAETITVTVDGNGDWSFDYLNKKIYSLQRFAYQLSTLTSVDFSSADDLLSCVDTSNAFYYCTNLISVNLDGKTFENVLDCSYMFNECYKMPSISLPNATFENVTNAEAMFSISSTNYQSSQTLSINLPNATFANATNIHHLFYQQYATTIISLPKATFASALDASDMFRNCYYLTTLDLSLATFASVTTAQSMFIGCRTITTLSLPSATFASCTTIQQMFNDVIKLQTLSLPSATFASVTSAFAFFAISGSLATQASLTSVDFQSATFASLQNAQQMWYNCRKLATLNMQSATFASVTNSTNTFQNCNLLADIDVPQNSTALLPTGTAAMDLHYSPLNYTSIYKVANWLSDLSGQTARSCTFRTSAWNALSSAEQTNIDTILSGKNWTRAIA